MSDFTSIKEERISKRNAAAQGAERGDRMSVDRDVSENREAKDPIRLEDRLAILRDVNTKLPQLPPIPGYHTFWATTTNQSDSLEHRFRLGYEFVHPSELPGFKLSTQQSSDGASDRITINEMVALKIPMELAEAYMKYNHYDMPLEQMNAHKNSIEMTRDGRGREIGFTGGDRDGNFRNGASDGFRVMSNSKNKTPSFEGVL